MSKIQYKDITKQMLTMQLFEHFDRTQDVESSWRNEDGTWVLEDRTYQDVWDKEDFNTLLGYLSNTLATGGMLKGAFHKNALVGFVSVESVFLDEAQEYLQLTSIHVDQKFRGLGIGKNLFSIAMKWAKEKGCKKLLISSHPSENTVAFYASFGCVDCTLADKERFSQSPNDRLLECAII